ncbi:MAG: PaaI family thioesterase [Spongiibacteraceae bacterium]|jgi:uncharacterized protein (TIGR00369 family)|nr:PaaI family thioesterase [Spongiibacteraceae bacterium]
MSDAGVPEGFVAFPRGYGFNDAIAPLYYRMVDNAPEFAFRVEKHHCNPIGICHGGVFMTFMDIALSGAICASLGKLVATPTISMAFDFLAGGQLGDWLRAEVQSVHTTRRLGFASGLVVGPSGPVARANGCFRLPSNLQDMPELPAASWGAAQ